MRYLVTDEPDADCQRCGGTGTVGGCGEPNCNHLHTISFCPCTNERYEGRP